MNTSTEYILQCNQSEPQADASGRMVDLMNENEAHLASHLTRWYALKVLNLFKTLNDHQRSSAINNDR